MKKSHNEESIIVFPTYSSRKIPFEKIEAFLIILLLLFYSGVWLSHIQPIAYDLKSFVPPPEDFAKKAATLLTYLIILLLIIRQYKQVAFVLAKEAFLALLILLAITSFFWSASPSVTADNAKALLRSTALGAYIAIRYDMTSILDIIKKVVAISAILSLLFLVLSPSEAIMQGLIDEPAGFRGVFFHKNDLGEIMGEGFLVFFASALDNKQDYLKKWFVPTFLFMILILTNAKTPLLVTLCCLLILPIRRVLTDKDYRIQVFLIVVFIFIGLACIIATTLYLGDFLIFIGKDPSFNGRSDVWPIVIEKVLDNPIIGYGYNGYWGAYAADFKAEFRRLHPLAAWTPGHSHNGFLELLLSLGIVGFVLFSLSLFNSISKAINQIRIDPSSEGVCYLQILLFFILNTQSGGLIPASSGLVWVLYVIVTYSLAIRFFRMKHIRRGEDQSELLIL